MTGRTVPADQAEVQALRDRIAILEELLEVQERTVSEQALRLEHATKDALASSEAKAMFLANMSHEIRTPLNAVIGMTSLLLDTRLDDVQRDYTETIRNSGEHLLSVINDILDFTKIESGKLELERSPFDLRTCLESSFDLIVTKASEKNLDLAFVIDEGLPTALRGDEGRLRQVLANLLSNAAKFTASGSIVVRVSGARRPSGRHELTFAVEDTGIGIPADRIGALFQSFSQVDASTTRVYGGTGLGLAICRRLVELMGGRIEVESEEGKGSTFRFTILVEVEAGPLTVTVRRGAQAFEGHSALVVDDLEVNRLVLQRMLGAWGMRTVCVAGGAEAIERVVREEFSVAILDLQMPGMDGLTLARELRRVAAGPLPHLVLLGSHLLDPSEVAPTGIEVMLTKPVKQAQLFTRLKSILDGRPASAPPGAGATPAGDGGRATRSSLRVLLAEDNPVNQKVATLTLLSIGIRADVVANGVEALEALERQRYDVVLMDVQMPEMDGLEAARRIRRRWADGERPLVIAMTANAMEGDREECLAAGMDGYLAKPVRREDLAEALGKQEEQGE